VLVKIDPHVHTRYSNAQADWFLHFFKCPECATSPEELYQICVKRGMTHVTATDHNCLDAALELAARYDNVILGEEVTAIFPDGDVHVHVGVLGLDEAMHRDIAQLRHNIYEFARYLADKRLPHFVAHPLFNHKMGILTLEHLEQMALLFKGWETLSGGRGKRSNALVHEFVTSLTPERIEDLANRYELAPLWDRPWVKHGFAGSDDHAGVYPGTNYVEFEAPDASTEAVVEGLGRGEFGLVGSPGCVASMGVQILGVGYKVVKQRWGDQINKKVFVFLDRILEQHTRTRLTPIEKLVEVLKTAFLPGDEAVFRSLVLTLRKQTRSDELFRAGFLSRDLYNEQVIELCSTVWDTLLVSVLKKKFDWHYLVTLGAAVLAPYIVSANAKNSEMRLFQQIEHALDLHPEPRVAWFVDGYSHVDGVSRAIRLFMERFERAGKPVKLIICDPKPYPSKMIKRFEPIFSTELKEYRNIVLHVPPALQVLRYLDAGGFTHVLCSSPGPMGFLGLGLGKLMKLPVCGVHHTDFVRFALEITRDPALTDLIRMAGSVYYRYMSKVFARSNAYRTDLVQFGVEADRIDVVPSWTNTERYHPAKRKRGLFGSSAGLTLLSVGRISEEKNLRFLLDMYARLVPKLKGLRLVIVGDGPFRAELEREAQGLGGVRFTGELHGEDLATAYASADVMVFPARHETFGNVVLEAQASGVPAIVANTGGPKEIIVPGMTGFVCNPDFPGEFEEAIERLYNDRDLLDRMRTASRQNALARFDADAIIENFFQSIVGTRAVSLVAPVISRLSAAS